MQVTEEKGQIVIKIDKNKTPVLTPSKKSFMVASSHGNVATTIQVDGRPVTVGVNCFIKNPDYVKP